MKLNAGNMNRRAAQGTLTRDELSELVRRLEHHEGNTYQQLHLLGVAGATQHRALIERYLAETSDPEIAWLCLMILVGQWDKPEAYAAEVERFLRGVSFDEDGQARRMALKVAGRVLAAREHRAIFDLLCATFEDPDEDRERRQVAYESLCQAAGRPEPQHRLRDFQRDTDPEVLAYIAAVRDGGNKRKRGK